MANNDSGLFSCRNTCWIVGGLLGLVALLLIWGSSVIMAIIVGVVVAVVVALVLQKLFCVDEGAASGVSSSTSAAVNQAASSTSAASSAATASTASTASTEAPAKKPAETASAKTSEPASDAAKVKPSKALSGEKELDERKGDWKYEKPADEKKPAAKKPAAKKPAAKKAPAKAETAKKAPAKKAAPKKAAAGADDMKMIKGVGPGIEKKLHDAGVTSFAQIAGWGASDVAEMDDKLNFRGRIERDDWVTQAKALAAGEETEFSKKASSSGLYEGNKKK